MDTEQPTIKFQFNWCDARQWSVHAMLLSLISQMLFHWPAAYDHKDVRTLYSEMEAKSAWTDENLWALFRAICCIQSTQMTFCIIDAVDQCDVGGVQLVKDLKRYCTHPEATLKLVLTSAPDSALTSAIDTSCFIDMNDEPAFDSERKDFIRDRLSGLEGLTMSDELVKRIVQKHQTYMEINMLISYINTLDPDIPTNGQVEALLDTGDGFSVFYTAAFSRILQLRKEDQLWCFRALTWLTFSFRPLTIDELAVAVTLERKSTSLWSVHQALREVTEQWISDRLGLFVRIEDNQCQLVHETAKDFLTQEGKKHGMDLQNHNELHGRLARLCIGYLSFDEMKVQRSFLSNDDMKPRLQLPTSPPKCYCLFDYAAWYWAAHYREYLSTPRDGVFAEQHYRPYMVTFLEQFHGEAWSEVYRLHDNPLEFTRLSIDTVPKPTKVLDEHSSHKSDDKNPANIPIKWWTNPLYTAAYLGLCDVAYGLWEKHEYTTDEQICALDFAAERGWASTVKAILDFEGEQSLPRELFHSTLRTVCANGHERALRELLVLIPAKVIPPTEAHEGEKPQEWGHKAHLGKCLLAAAEKGHAKVVAALIEAGADAESQGDEGNTALILAAQNGFDSVIDELLPLVDPCRPNDSGYEALHCATKAGHVYAVRALLSSERCDVNTPRWMIKPVHLAAQEGHLDVMKELLEHDPDLAVACDESDYTPLCWAAVEGHADVVSALLDAGADPLYRNRNEDTPLGLACNYSRLDAIDALLATGQDLNVPGNGGWLPLHSAVIKNDKKVVEKLLETDGFLNSSAWGDSWTPLHLAVYRGKTDMVTLFLKNDAEVNRKVKPNGYSPLHLCSESTELAHMLLDAGAEPNVTDMSGRTPLFYSAGGKNMGMTQEYLSRGLSPTAPDVFGRVPLDIALDKDIWDVLQSQSVMPETTAETTEIGKEKEMFPESVQCRFINNGFNIFQSGQFCDVCNERIDNVFFYRT
jgi:ankyrin repeat protein